MIIYKASQMDEYPIVFASQMNPVRINNIAVVGLLIKIRSSRDWRIVHT